MSRGHGFDDGDSDGCHKSETAVNCSSTRGPTRRLLPTVGDSIFWRPQQLHRRPRPLDLPTPDQPVLTSAPCSTNWRRTRTGGAPHQRRAGLCRPLWDCMLAGRWNTLYSVAHGAGGPR